MDDSDRAANARGEALMLETLRKWYYLWAPTSRRYTPAEPLPVASQL